MLAVSARTSCSPLINAPASALFQQSIGGVDGGRGLDWKTLQRQRRIGCAGTMFAAVVQANATACECRHSDAPVYTFSLHWLDVEMPQGKSPS